MEIIMKGKNVYSEFLNGIKQEEINFSKQFASYEEKEYGILFYMADNKESYDGNDVHGVAVRCGSLRL